MAKKKYFDEIVISLNKAYHYLYTTAVNCIQYSYTYINCFICLKLPMCLKFDNGKGM